MKIGVTSKNQLKVDAVAAAYAGIGISAEVIGYKANSGVGEQPEEKDTLLGAKNRILDVFLKEDGLDRIVSIESGIFFENGSWIDRAVAVIYDTKTGKEYTAYSEGVVFPTEYVDEARRRGFDKTTVGQVMFEAGYVKDPKDPHLSITGISREVYIKNFLCSLVRQAEHME